MKSKLFILLAALVLCTGGFIGCATKPLIAPATNVAISSYTVQGAEHTLRAAKDTSDLVFALVHDNHDLVVTKFPTIYAAVKKLSETAPDILRRANAAKNVFKYNRTPDNQANLDTLMKTVAQILADSQSYANQLQKATP